MERERDKPEGNLQVIHTSDEAVFHQNSILHIQRIGDKRVRFTEIELQREALPQGSHKNNFSTGAP